MSTAENEIEEKKKNGEAPELASDEDTSASKKSKTPVKAASSKTIEEDEDDEDTSDEDDSNDDDEPPSSRKPLAKTRADKVERKSVHHEAARGGSPIKNVLTIARREMRSYFDSLIAYVVIGGSTLGIGIFFFLMQNGGFWEVDRASMARLFAAMPWALAVLVIPLVTMRSIAEERNTGTLELLITMPVRDYEVILGKFSAALGMCLMLLAITVLYPLAMFVWPWHLGALDWGPVWTGYLGLTLFSAAGVALGLMFSSFTESQIIAFFLTAGVMLFMQVIGGIVETMPGAIGDIIAFVSFETRFQPFARGLIDTRAVVYFVSIAVLCLLVAFRSLESRKWK